MKCFPSTKRLFPSITIFRASFGVISFAAERLAISAGISDKGQLASEFAVGTAAVRVGDGAQETNAT